MKKEGKYPGPGEDTMKSVEMKDCNAILENWKTLC